jgi:carbamoyl-phosphate synthase small subunit
MKANLILEDGTCYTGEAFGATASSAGEVVFNTGMVGYPESMTDPSYAGQIVVLTYPLIGNYGVPSHVSDDHQPAPGFESDNIQVRGLIVSSVSHEFSHRTASQSLDSWMKQFGIPGITGIDTRALTKKLREKGTMLGKIIVSDEEIAWDDPNARNIVAEVSTTRTRLYPSWGEKSCVLVDLGTKHGIIRKMNARGINVLKVPWNYDWTADQVDGVILSNGPGNPKACAETIHIIRKALHGSTPIFGICLGHQLLSLAAGGDTFKLKYGHRSQNQPAIEVGTKRCYITSQNHGFAVDETSLDADWKPWLFNANDGTNEGVRHRSKPFCSVQFHPEANPGPSDTEFFFDKFIQTLEHAATTS